MLSLSSYAKDLSCRTDHAVPPLGLFSLSSQDSTSIPQCALRADEASKKKVIHSDVTRKDLSKFLGKKKGKEEGKNIKFYDKKWGSVIKRNKLMGE